MPHDETFRRILLTAVIVTVPIAAFFRIRSQLSGETLDRRQEGWFILLSLRPVAFVWLGAIVLFLVDPRRMAWSALSLPVVWRWAGVIIGGAALLLLVWTFHSLGRNLTDTVVTRRDATLVTQGPYRFMRHPFYAAFLGSVLANGLATANCFITITGLTVWLLLYIRIPREEARLIARFGDDYRVYMRTTGRFWPRFGRRNSPDGA